MAKWKGLRMQDEFQGLSTCSKVNLGSSPLANAVKKKAMVKQSNCNMNVIQGLCCNRNLCLVCCGKKLFVPTWYIKIDTYIRIAANEVKEKAQQEFNRQNKKFSFSSAFLRSNRTVHKRKQNHLSENIIVCSRLRQAAIRLHNENEN